MQHQDGISVVIPNYNGEKLLPEILPCVIKALAAVNLPSEIIIADDASQDGSERIVSASFPGVIWLGSSVNNGFAVTANRGLRRARYNWVLLLNSDVKLEPDYFLPLLKYMDRPEVFGVMGRIIGWEDDAIQDGAKYPFFHGLKLKTSGNCIPVGDAPATGLYSLYLSGANAFINKKLFMEAGGFNELFSPFYAEDTELCIRAWRLGYLCLYEHNAVCRHRVSATIRKDSNRKKEIGIIYNRNKMFLHALHLDGMKRVAWFLQVSGEALFRFLLFQTGYWRSYTLFLHNHSKLAESRKQLRVTAGEKELLSLKQVCRNILQQIGAQPTRKF